MQVRWVRKVLQNLEQAHSYIAKDDPEAAIRMVLKIQVAVNQLAQFSLLGRVGRIDRTRELVIANTPYFVVYRLQENTAEILRVLHASRRYPG